ncbi:MAG: hypothetical protein QOG63_3035 [Thermoleophilaceae bacterium]|jgi:hypothetical protein|nr:hypothetical protein [Thermoleophilaceae bacterium]
MRRLILLSTILTLTALAPPAAHASKSQESLFQDDAQLLLSGESRRAKSLDELKSLGVDVIRVNVLWTRYAPKPNAAKKPSFNAADPASYNFGELDSLVSDVQSRGMAVLFTVTAPGPAWASGCKGSANKRRICRPKAGEFGAFTQALGSHFASVHRWSVYNEPNQGGWLTPQYVRRGGGWVRESPTIYRGLVRAATSALAASGHGSDQILLGETAPIGRTSGSHFKRTSAPVDFYRDLFCLNSRGGALSGKAAKIRGCNGFKKLAVTGVAHHPYTRGAGQNPRSRPGRSDITLSTISRLSLWLDRAARRGRISRGLPIYLTEYGVQTNPPDRFAGASLGNQAKWLNESDWMAWNNGRIASVAQYELRDEPALPAFQTGLRFKSGKAKPSLAAYRLPIWAVKRGKSTKIWLQVRPESRIGQPQQVTVQYRKKGSRKFRNLKTYTVSDGRGFKRVSTKVRASYWRFSWNGQHSRAAKPTS